MVFFFLRRVYLILPFHCFFWISRSSGWFSACKSETVVIWISWSSLFLFSSGQCNCRGWRTSIYVGKNSINLKFYVLRWIDFMLHLTEAAGMEMLNSSRKVAHIIMYSLTLELGGNQFLNVKSYLGKLWLPCVIKRGHFLHVMNSLVPLCMLAYVKWRVWKREHGWRTGRHS